MQRTLLCALSASALAAVAGCGSDADGHAGVPVTLADFTITVPSTVAVGAVTFDVRNAGPTPHQFTVESPAGRVVAATPTLDPKASRALTVTLAPGTYTYLCALPGHASLGMKGTFRVGDAP